MTRVTSTVGRRVRVGLASCRRAPRGTFALTSESETALGLDAPRVFDGARWDAALRSPEAIRRTIAVRTRAFQDRDIPALLGWFPTPMDLAQWGSPARHFPLDEAQVRAFLRETAGPDPKRFMWVREREGAMAATATTVMDRLQGVALLGFVAVSPAMRGSGIAHPFLEDVVERTFAEPAIDRVELNVYTFNARAIRAYERLGFVREGIRRSLARMGTERWDAAHYSLLRTEFERRLRTRGVGADILGERAGAKNESAIRLRPATRADVPALIRLLRRSWLVSWAPELPFEAVQLFAAHDPAREHAETGWPSFVVATLGGVLVGMSHVEGPTIEHLHVDPIFWRKGVGTRLMDDAERGIARSHAHARLEVRAFNGRARAFYARRGWTDHRRYPGTECNSPVETVEMHKPLRA